MGEEENLRQLIDYYWIGVILSTVVGIIWLYVSGWKWWKIGIVLLVSLLLSYLGTVIFYWKSVLGESEHYED